MPVIGIPITGDQPGSLLTRSATVPNIFGEEVRSRKLAVRTSAGEANSVSVPLYDDNGQLVTDLPGGPAKYRIAEAVKKTELLYEAKINGFDTTEGRVIISPPQEIMTIPGIYDVSLGFFDENEKLRYTRNFYIYNEPSTWGSSSTSALPTIDTIRLNLRDSDVVENELLGDRQFGLEEICAAAVRTIEYWNNVPPITAADTRNFPYANLLQTGIEIHLFEILLEWYRKNRLPYNAGGISVDDMGKLNEYIAAVQSRKQEFIRLVQRTKVSENLRAAFAKLG